MITRRSVRVAAFACAAGLTGVACGGASSGDDSGSTSSAVVPAVETTPGDVAAEAAPADEAESGGVVPAALRFTAPLIGGGEIVGDELAGKPTAFWFWSPT